MNVTTDPVIVSVALIAFPAIYFRKHLYLRLKGRKDEFLAIVAYHYSCGGTGRLIVVALQNT